MSRKRVNLKINKLKSELGLVEGVELSFGKIIEEKWGEPMGPTPFPKVVTLRDWDLKLLQRYKPFYLPFCDVCCLCTMGKCDLSGDKRGACGLNMAAQQSRIVLLACCIGASTHIAHARHLVEHLIEKYGSKSSLDIGGLTIDIEAPVIRLVCGIKPEKLRDLEEALDWCEGQINHLLSATHTLYIFELKQLSLRFRGLL